MKWLFIHRDMPGQYQHVIRELVSQGHQLVAIGRDPNLWIKGVRVLSYAPLRQASSAHLYVQEFDLAVRNGLAVAEICERLKTEGFMPDAVVGHNGWGEIFFVKDVWPSTPLLGYFEFFYRPKGSDANFDPEFPAEPDQAIQLRVRNAINLVGLEAADLGQTPTHWQRDQYPRLHRDRINVVHEGIDTEIVRPDSNARLWLADGVSIGTQDQTITYCSRDLEPYRGFHIFMRALPAILRRLPKARVLIVGGDGVSYGALPSSGGSWRQRLLDELGDQIDLQRVHFLGRLPFQQYLAVLQISAVHVYLTYPFVLSWQLIEALAVGCSVVSCRTGPVEEVINQGENGYLVDFFDTEELASAIELAATKIGAEEIKVAARRSVIDRYDLRTVCLPAHLSLLAKLTGGRAITSGF